MDLLGTPAPLGMPCHAALGHPVQPPLTSTLKCEPEIVGSCIMHTEQRGVKKKLEVPFTKQSLIKKTLLIQFKKKTKAQKLVTGACKALHRSHSGVVEAFDM